MSESLLQGMIAEKIEKLQENLADLTRTYAMAKEIDVELAFVGSIDGVTIIYLRDYQEMLKLFRQFKKKLKISFNFSSQFSAAGEIYFRYRSEKVSPIWDVIFTCDKDEIPEELLGNCKIVEEEQTVKEYRMVCDK